jgi:hypothetical protein
VDGGVLASLDDLETLVSSCRDWTKDFGGTRFEKGYTIVVSDVNRGR